MLLSRLQTKMGNKDMKKNMIAGLLVFFLFSLSFSYATADDIETAGSILQIVIPAAAFAENGTYGLMFTKS